MLGCILAEIQAKVKADIGAVASVTNVKFHAV